MDLVFDGFGGLDFAPGLTSGDSGFLLVLTEHLQRKYGREKKATEQSQDAKPAAANPKPLRLASASSALPNC